MSIAFDRWILILSFVIPQAVELSTCTGVGGCLYPISSSVVRSILVSFMLLNRPPVSASAADETMALITPVGVSMGVDRKTNIS